MMHFNLVILEQSHILADDVAVSISKGWSPRGSVE